VGESGSGKSTWAGSSRSPTRPEIFDNRRHPYTRALIDSISRMSADSVTDQFEVEGEPPSPINVPSGCRFHPRCPVATDRCRTQDPGLSPIAPGHASACLLAAELPRTGVCPH
jgi:oligopeptide/dipeptide ABC transporter ATP-binding protein